MSQTGQRQAQPDEDGRIKLADAKAGSYQIGAPEETQEEDIGKRLAVQGSVAMRGRENRV